LDSFGKRTAVALTVLVVVVGCLILAGREKAPTTHVPITLRTEKLAPNEELGGGNYLGSPRSIEIINDTIYVADQRRREIVMLDTAGVFLGAIGVEGSGPGEFRTLLSIKKTPDEQHICSLANAKVAVFTSEGRYVSQFTKQVGSMIETIDDCIIVATAPRPSRGAISMFSYDGELVSNFSQLSALVSATGTIQWLTSDVFVAVQDDRIWEMYKYFNILRLHSSSGDLLMERALDDKHLVEMSKLSASIAANPQPVSASNASIRTPSQINYALRYYLGSLWLLSSPEKYLQETDEDYRVNRYIYQLDLQGNIVKMYLQPRRGARDIIVLRASSPFRAILLAGGAPRIYWVTDADEAAGDEHPPGS
jgi:hypothetical protein